MDRLPLHCVVFARRPEAGRVKTRLSGPGGPGREQAAEVAAAMGRCILDRLAARWPVTLAVTPDGGGLQTAQAYGRPDLPTIDQGDGDLGRRLERVWRAVGGGGKVAFFGIDSPDVPEAHLDEIEPALAEGSAAVGPTDDGGYWTLAAPRFLPALLGRIDWGTASVYDQTVRRAEDAEIKLRTLSRWHDVDDPADLDALRRRLADAGGDRGPLATLADRLDELMPTPEPSRRA